MDLYGGERGRGKGDITYFDIADRHSAPVFFRILGIRQLPKEVSIERIKGRAGVKRKQVMKESKEEVSHH